MKSKIALIGANGQLGSDLTRVLSQDQEVNLSLLTHNDIEIADKQSIKQTLDIIKPTIIINTAAYNIVDKAENEPEKAFLINAIAVKYLSQYCSTKNITLVHISSDYVFGLDQKRKTPYTEDDLPGPVNAYGISKLAGEYFAQYGLSNHFIIRSSGLFGIVGSSGKGGNFITFILKKAQEKKRVEVVNDQIVTPTYTYDLAKQITTLIKTNKYGLYHASAEGSCTWYEFAQEVFKLTNNKADLIPISSRELSQTARRAQYCVLENNNLKKLDINVMKDWKEGLKEYIQEKI